MFFLFHFLIFFDFDVFHIFEQELDIFTSCDYLAANRPQCSMRKGDQNYPWSVWR